MVQDTGDTEDQRTDTAGAVDQVHNTRGHAGYSGYWWLVQGDHKTQDTSVTGDQVQDTVIVEDQGVKVQGYRGSWGSDTERWGQDLKNWASWVQADKGCRLQNKTERYIFAFIIIISASQN